MSRAAAIPMPQGRARCARQGWRTRASHHVRALTRGRQASPPPEAKTQTTNTPTKRAPLSKHQRTIRQLVFTRRAIARKMTRQERTRFRDPGLHGFAIVALRELVTHVRGNRFPFGRSDDLCDAAVGDDFDAVFGK